MGLGLSYGAGVQFTSIGPLQSAFERRWTEPRVSYEYGVYVSDVPNAPKPRRPKSAEAWRVGLVQNVVAQTIRVVYDSGTILKKSWTAPLLDADVKLGAQALPFYAPPVIIAVNVPGAALANPVSIPLFASIAATNGPDGFHFTFPTPNKRPRDWDDRSVQLSFADCPGFSVPTYSGKDILLETDHLISLHFWVVAIGPAGQVVLAESDVFTLVMIMKFADAVSQTKGSDSRSPWYRTTGLAGTITSLPENLEKGSNWDRFVDKHAADIHMRAPARSTPVTRGTLANTAGREWMAENGLIPVSAR